MKAVDEAWLAAYRAADYRVIGERPFTLKVGEPSSDLQRLYEKWQVSSATFITACNPRSSPLGDKENQQRMAQLAADIAALGLMALEGIGEDPSGEWPGEPSLLVLGISLEQARGLGGKYEQNAIVWCGQDAISKLIYP